MFALMYPERIIFGCNALEQLSEEAARFGRKVLLVSGHRAMRKSGILDRVVNQLDSGKMEVTLFDEVEHDPSLGTVDKGIKLAREKECEIVVGLGGGSALDVAKAVACLSKLKGHPREYHQGREVEAAGLPFVAIPTTAGTGAEITSNSVITDREKKVKKSIRSPYMIARVALVDPLLTLSLPAKLTAYTGMDALTQAVESFICRTSNPISDSLALRAVDLLFHNLPEAIREGENVEIREKVALGSLLSAMAFSQTGVGAVHALSHPVGARFGVPHGLACAVLLPGVMKFNLEVCREKFSLLAYQMGGEKPEEVLEILRELLKEVGISPTLKEWRIKEDDFSLLISQSRGGTMSKNPRKMSDEELKEILRKVI